MPASTPSRKAQHVRIVLERDVAFRRKTSGFEEWEFVHNALPELDLRSVDTSCTFLGKRVAAPLMISCMTGGYTGAERINRQLAETCAAYPIAMGVGSQRQALENRAFHASFKAARDAAPGIPLVGNIGGAQLVKSVSTDRVRAAVDMIRADALAVHLNPVQELIQPEGDTDFRGVARAIETLVRGLDVPIIVKEVGAGISAPVARRLHDLGVKYVDVAGAGGTSWAAVELERRNGTHADLSMFREWGVRTADAIVAVKRSMKSSVTIIGSGGITNGLEMAKAIALGASMTAAARPMLRALEKNGPRGLRTLIDAWIAQLRGAMFLTGSGTLAQLKRAELYRIEN